jgi:hypothetical protein
VYHETAERLQLATNKATTNGRLAAELELDSAARTGIGLPDERSMEIRSDRPPGCRNLAKDSWEAKEPARRVPQMPGSRRRPA